MRFYFTLIFICTFTVCHSQDTMSVGIGAPKRDEAFSKALNTILFASGKDFAVLPKHFAGRDIVDSTWTLDAVMPGADEAKISKSKGSVILYEHFDFGGGKLDVLRLLEKIKASLPADFRYVFDYDAASGISQYSFICDNMAVAHPGYPDLLMYTGDVQSGSIAVILYR